MRAPRTPFDPRFVTHAAALLLLVLAPSAAHAQGQPPPVIVEEPRQTQPQAAPTPSTAAPTPKPARDVKTPPLTGRVVGEAGEPIPEISVTAYSRAAGSNPRTPYSASTDEGGNFSFAGLAPGLYQLNVFQPGFVIESDPATGRPNFTYRPGDDAIVRLVRGGVVTGTVTDQQGQPLVQLNVRAVRVRDLDGAAPEIPFPFALEDRTDDRGVYRIYGLRPGLYVVYGGGYNNSPFSPAAAYGGEAATFYPSGTRDTAVEVAVRGGQETTGIDIRYRDEPGRRVTGTIESPSGSSGEFGVGVNLTYAATAMNAATAFVNPRATDQTFSFEGVADGEYDLQATGGVREGLTISSAPQRVSVRGGDVTGLRLTLVPLANASGTLRFEPAADSERATEACKAVRSTQLPQETIVAAAAERARASTPGTAISRLSMQREATPDETGSFTVRSLEAGRYRLSARLFDEALYVRSIQLPGAAPAAAAPQRATGSAAPQRAATSTQRAALTVARDVFELKSGQQLTGLLVRVAEGAASLSGNVAPATPAVPLPSFAQLRVHLVPQERERAEDTLRYYETALTPDGTFSFKNLAPGRYLALLRPAATGEAALRPAAWDSPTRDQLRREAEAANTTLELQPCQRTADFTLRFPAK